MKTEKFLIIQVISLNSPEIRETSLPIPDAWQGKMHFSNNEKKLLFSP